MTRETAYLILTRHLTNPYLLAHSLAVEATMSALAPTFNADPEIWGIAGLLHDADYEKAKGHPEKHGILLFELEPNSIPSLIEHAIKAHNYEETGVKPESPLDWALYCCDELTGFIMAVAATFSENNTNQTNAHIKLTDVTPEMVLQRLTDKNFQKHARRQPILLCEAKLGIPLQTFVSTTLTAMQRIHEKLEAPFDKEKKQ